MVCDDAVWCVMRLCVCVCVCVSMKDGSFLME